MIFTFLTAILVLSLVGSTQSAPDFQYERMNQLAALTALDRSAAAGMLVLIGSSTVARWPAAVLPAAIRLGVPGDTVPGLASRVAGYQSLRKARGIAILIGFNDLTASCNALGVDLRSLVSALPSKVPIALVGVQGVSPKTRVRLCGGRMAELTSDFNARLQFECAQLPYCRFVPHPISELVETETSQRYHSDDGVHLSADGYRALAGALAQTWRVFANDQLTSSASPG